MSVQASNWAWLQPLSGNQKIILLRLADFANEVHGCFASNKRLCADARVSKNTVIKTLRQLEEDGYIEKLSEIRENGGCAANRFMLNINVGGGAETEPGGVQLGEQGGVHTGEQGKELTKELTEEQVVGAAAFKLKVRDKDILSAWLSKGYDLENNILPTIKKLKSRCTGKINTLGYFTSAIEENHTTPKTKMPTNDAEWIKWFKEKKHIKSYRVHSHHITCACGQCNIQKRYERLMK